ncbi:hypothetical protein [Numidum massiliense]|uniref:hypothetical protein n=1 Tax=Numidum massiliense TaxID=1522315 RepID=UPI0006D5A3AA|nr:hypothetical protein [Numidum massiliense]
MGKAEEKGGKQRKEEGNGEKMNNKRKKGCINIKSQAGRVAKHMFRNVPPSSFFTDIPVSKII